MIFDGLNEFDWNCVYERVWPAAPPLYRQHFIYEMMSIKLTDSIDDYDEMCVLF